MKDEATLDENLIATVERKLFSGQTEHDDDEDFEKEISELKIMTKVILIADLKLNE